MAYNTTAKGLSALGRNGDNTLLHVSKDELAGLQSLIGHKLPTNPHTGLQEAFDLKNIIAMLGIGALGAATGGAALAAAPGITTMGATALGAGEGALLGGAYSASQGKGFGAGALGGALSGGLGAYGGSNLPGASTAQTTTSMSEPADALLTTPKIAAAPELPYGYDKFLPAAPDKFTVPYGAGIKTPTEFSLGDTSKYQSLINDIPDVTAKDIPLTDKLSTATGNQLSAMGNKDNMWEWGKMAGMGSLLGSSAQDMVEQNQAMANQIRQEKLAAQANEQQQQQYFKDLGYPLASLSDLNNSDTQSQFDYYKNIINPKQGYAAGGPITMTLPMGGVPVTATFPARYASELEQIDIPHEINQAQNVAKEGTGMANGGYINTQPVNPNAFYPQSQIHSAQPYPAATPQRHEIIEGFEDGGMLDGPGDGMSDDIPANIDGEEEIRLADGEFVVPPDLVRMLGFGDPEKGAELLDNLLPLVRQAAHGKKEQIKQDAGKLAAEKMLVRAAKGKA
jgi:hypothetical protein